MLQNQYLKVRLGLIDLRENKTQGDDALKFRYFVEICLVHIGAKVWSSCSESLDWTISVVD